MVFLKDVKYEVDFQLFGRVKVDVSNIDEGCCYMFCVIQKEESGWWDRLLKEGKVLLFVKVDWNCWIDEDEEEEVGKFVEFNMSFVMDWYLDLDEMEDSDDDDDEVFDM